jgi:hypothetical protein
MLLLKALCTLFTINSQQLMSAFSLGKGDMAMVILGNVSTEDSWILTCVKGYLFVSWSAVGVLMVMIGLALA